MAAGRSYGASAAALAVVVALVVVGAAQADPDCTWDSGAGATYDLSFLKLSGSYAVQDKDVVKHNYTYEFNVCGNTAEIPQTGRPPYTGCETTWGSGVALSGPAPAYQVSNLYDYCHRLGNSAEDVQWSQYDPYDVSRGVTLTYINGDPCGGTKGNRSLAIHFMCYDDGTNIPDKEPVLNKDECNYEIFVPSTFGCPTACFGSNFKLCSSHGVCGFDPDEQKARCFCNNGYAGTYCSEEATPPETGLSAAGGVLIVVSILLVLVLALLGYLWFKIKSLRLDPQMYKTLGDGTEMGLADPGPGVDDTAL